MIITLDQAKEQCRVVHSSDDEYFFELIDAATASIVAYMKGAAAVFLDSSGDVIIDAVPADVVMACKLEVAHLYKNREGQSDSKIPDQFGYGYQLCAAATAKLYHYRVPTLA